VRFLNGPLAQVFFPGREIADAAEVQRRAAEYPYMRLSAWQGMVAWIGQPQWVVKAFNVHTARSPVSASAEMAAQLAPATGGHDADLATPILFSHGLGGHSDIHTVLAYLLAQQGFVVFCLEHEDGAGSYARTETGGVVAYNRPPKATNADEARGYEQKLQTIREFRAPQLRHREKECVWALRWRSCCSWEAR
jgi:predicted dienelactone hydrolase